MMNNLAGKTCNCDVMLSIMERNSENIVGLQHDLTTMDERINSQMQIIQNAFILIFKNMEDIADKMEAHSVYIDVLWNMVDINYDEMEDMQSNLNQAVLKNSAEIDYIEDAMG